MTVEIHTQAIADYLPNGVLFEAKNIQDSNFRKLLTGLSGELFTAQGYISEFEREYFPSRTLLFLEEWEAALGIPDQCFLGTGSVIERRRDIIVKLAGLGVTTAADFVVLAAVFGITVAVTPATDVIRFPLTFPIFMISTLREARYTIIIRSTLIELERFTLTYPILFGTGGLSIIRCLFNQVKPANTTLIFLEPT